VFTTESGIGGVFGEKVIQRMKAVVFTMFVEQKYWYLWTII
jgi:hypothetical protein